MQQFFEDLPIDSTEKLVSIRKQKLEVLRDIKNEALKKAPRGFLRIAHNKGTVQYYNVTDSSNPNGKYISKKKTKLLHSLAQKEYDEKLIAQLEEEIARLDYLLDVGMDTRIKELYEDTSPHKKMFVKPVILPDDMYIEEWQSVDYPQKPFAQDAAEHYTAKGERVRSKSEVIIADTLERMGIPYRYEFPLELKNYTVHPDFCCLNVRTRREFFWEHFGMMDDSEYAASAVAKLRDYEEGGFFPGTNLILSMETASRQVNVRLVKKLIQEFLM